MIWYATIQLWSDMAIIKLWSYMLQYNYDMICYIITMISYATIQLWYANAIVQLWSDMATIQ